MYKHTNPRATRKSKLPDEEVIFRFAWRRLLFATKQRGIPVRISKKLVRKLIFGHCHYCGALASNTIMYSKRKYALHWNGIDRIDNNKGYTKPNVVTCCKTCNYMKGELSHSEFITHCALITQKFLGFMTSVVPLSGGRRSSI